MERLQKYVILRGTRGQCRHLALIDTGTPRVVIPRAIAQEAGTRPTRQTGVLSIMGSRVDVEIHMADIEIVSGGCRATVEALVPVKDSAKTGFIVGNAFLQKTGARISYRDNGYPVFCVNESSRKRRR